jgi:hypothetical protein
MSSSMAALLGVTSIFLGTVVLLLITAEAGFFVGRRHRNDSVPDGRLQVSMLEGALLGLLGLLIGFTFSMAVGRYDRRQDLVIQEANALGTASLRCDFLPPEARALAVGKLREYADARLEAFEAGGDSRRFEEAVRKAGRLQSDLWALVREEARAKPTAITSLTLITAMNDLFDLGEVRRATLDDTVPSSVWVVLYIVAALTSGSLGYGSGLTGRRLTLPTSLVPLLLGILLTLLLDLDHPRHGLIRASQASIIRVRETLK